MDKDKRNRQKPIPDNLRQVLNRKQIEALNVIQSLGWRLKFVRRPLFLEAQPVVYNAKFDQVGILDPDGNIDLELELSFRTSEQEQEQAAQPAATPPRQDKRKGMIPVPENLDGLLNDNQLRALHQIETFGWKLHFVRRPLFQEPVAGIISPDGNQIATLETDGRINLMPPSSVRTDDLQKPDTVTEAVEPQAASVKKSL